jgi:replication factor C small subunit
MLPKDKIINRLRYIVKEEDISIPSEQEEEFFNILFFISGGDLRKAINSLQMAVALELLEDLNINEILKISGFVEKPVLEKLKKHIEAKKLREVREVFESLDYLDSRNFIRQLIELLPEFKNVKKDNTPQLRAYFGDIDYRISQGADEQVQLTALLAELISYQS